MPSFYVAVFLLFFAALCINFAWVATYSSHVTGEGVVAMTRRVLPPVLPSEIVSAVFAVGLVKFYEDIGLISLAFFALLLGTFQYILRELLRLATARRPARLVPGRDALDARCTRSTCATA